MIFAHPFSNILATKALQPVWKTKELTKRQELIIWITSIVSTVSPDFDLVYSLFTGAHHRYLITHTFAPYIPLLLAAVIFTFVFSKKLKSAKKDFLQPAFLRVLCLIAFVGIALHLFTDTLGAPVRLLYPFSNIEFSIGKINSFIHSENLNLAFQYYTTPLFIFAELFWIIGGSTIILDLVKKNIYVKSYFPKVLGSLVFAAVSMLTLLLIVRP